MPPTSAAMELKVLINVLQSGTALKNLLSQTNQLSQALTALQTKANAAGGGAGVAGQATAAAQAATTATQSLKGMSDAGEVTAKTMAKVESTINGVVRALKFVTTGWLALQSVRFLRGLADEAARAQVLSTVLHVVAQNSGYTAEEIDKVDRAVQRLGITAESSRQSLTQFLQAKLDLKFAPALARAAQDLAVIAGVNSSDTFKRMIVNIQQLDTLGLRWMGIIVDRNLAEQKYKQNHQEITGALQKRHQQEALMLEVLEKAKVLEGTYVMAMGDVDKQVQSLDRITKTYRQTLGDSLLPAYSAIVAEITAMFEKLTILAQKFSSNREQAQAWADTLGAITGAIADFIVFIAEHIDQIITLVKWYAIFKGAFLVWRSVIGVIDLLTRLQLAIRAFIAGQVGFSVVMKMMTADTTAHAIALQAEALALQQVAAAQTAVGATAPAAAAGMAATATAAATTEAAVAALMTTWTAMAALMALPVIGYIGYKTYQYATTEHDPVEEARKQIASMQKGEAFGRLERGEATLPGVLQYFFEQWKAQHPEFVSTFETELGLMRKFREEIEKPAKQNLVTGIAEQIKTVKAERDAARRELAELPKTDENRAERAALGQKVLDAGTKLADLRKQYGKQLEAEPLLSPEKLTAMVDRVKTLTQEFTRVRNAAASTPDQVLDAEVALEQEKERLAVQRDRFEVSLQSKGVTDPTRAADERALAAMKKAVQDAGTAMEDYTRARQALFGEDVFTDEGRKSAGFVKAAGGYAEMMRQANQSLQEGIPIADQTAAALREGLARVGKAVETGLDLKELREMVADAKQLPLGLNDLADQALRLGVKAERDARLAVRAPLVAENKAIINERMAVEIEAAQRAAEVRKTETGLALADLDQRNKQQLVAVGEYERQRLALVQSNLDAELAAIEKRIDREQQLLRATDADPRDIAASRAALRAAEEEAFQNRLQSQKETFQSLINLSGRRWDLDREITTNLNTQLAQVGGLKEALEEADHLRQMELDKLNTYNTEENQRLFLLKDINREHQIYQKFLDREYQTTLAILQARQNELDLRQARRDTAAAADQSAVALGRMTGFDARVRNNLRIQEAMEDNLRRQALAQEKLAAQREAERKDAEELTKFLNELEKVGVSQVELQRIRAENQRKWASELFATESALEGLRTEYENLAGSAELASKQIRESFISGFSDALTQTIVDFKKAGEAWVSLSKSLSNEIVSVFMRAFTERLFARIGIFGGIDRALNWIFGRGGMAGPTSARNYFGLGISTVNAAEGGPISGPGTGTSDSIPAMLSAGEHVMPAAKAAKWMPLLEGIRLGKLSPAFALGGVVSLQSIASTSIIPHRYAAGGVVTDAGASTVVTGAGANGTMMVQLHPDTMNMTMREWFEHEVVRQHARR